MKKQMFRVFGIALILSLMFQCSAFCREEGRITIRNIVEDPMEQVLVLNGTLNLGADRSVTLLAEAAGGSGTLQHLEVATTKTGGSFSFVVNTKNWEGGEYQLTLKSSGCENVEHTLIVPFTATASVPISASVRTGEIWMSDTTNINPEHKKAEVILNNAKLLIGKLDDTAFTLTGVPAGIRVAANAISENTIEFLFSGVSAEPIIEETELSLVLKNGLILGGAANTASQPISGIKIVSSATAQSVLFRAEQTENKLYMKNLRQAKDGENSFTLTITNGNLSKDGVLTKGTDYDFTDSGLNGLTVNAVANQQSGSIRFTLSGYSTVNLTTNLLISDLKLFAALVENKQYDSIPVSFLIQCSVTNGVENTPNGGHTGGTGGHTGGTGGGATGNITGGNATEVVRDLIRKNVIFVKPKIVYQSVNFSDVENHWAKESVECLAQMGILRGVGNDDFFPDGKVTRAEFITMIARTFEMGTDTKKSVFSDVDALDWYGESVLAAFEAGIISEADRFRPNEPITREEMTKIVTNTMFIYLYEPKNLISYQNEFSDSGDISDWAVTPIAVAATLGIVRGNEQKCFLPKENTTRAEAATVLYRMMDRITLAD